MKKLYRGSFTVEASVVVPVLFMMIVVLIYTLFYYHDKNIVSGAAYETVVVGAEQKEMEEQELEEYFQQRVRGKLILFLYAGADVQIEKEQIKIQCTARKKWMKLSVDMSANRTEPEKFIRNIRKLKKAGEMLGENE